MARLHHIRDVLRIDRRAQRQIAAGQRFRDRDDIRRDPVLLGRAPDPGAPRSAHHLVADHQNAVTVANLGHRLGIAFGRRQRATRSAHDRFEDEGRHGVRPQPLDFGFQLCRARCATNPSRLTPGGRR